MGKISFIKVFWSLESGEAMEVFNLEYQSLKLPYFQMQFVYVNIDRILRSDISCYYQGLRRRLNYLEHSTDAPKGIKENNPSVEWLVIGSKSNREPTINRECKNQEEKKENV